MWVIAGAAVLVIACGVASSIYYQHCNAIIGGELQDSGHGRVAAQPLLPAAPPPSPLLPLMRTVPSKMMCFSCPLCLTELKAELATCERQNATCAGELTLLTWWVSMPRLPPPVQVSPRGCEQTSAPLLAAHPEQI